MIAGLEFVRQHKDKPFFLYLPVTIPHVALQVPEDSLAEYRGKWEDPPYVGGRGYEDVGQAKVADGADPRGAEVPGAGPGWSGRADRSGSPPRSA